MPKAKSKRREQNSDDEADDEAPSQSMTQADKALSAASADEVERRVNDLVQFLLIMDQKKLPIKRLDINKTVLKELSKAFPAMIQRAKDRLSNVFGIDLVEVEAKGTKTYMLINKFETDTDNPHLVWPNEDNAKMGLLMVVLSVIFMKENVIQDVELYHFLKKLGIDVDRSHGEFGDAKKLLTKEFVQQKYLEYTPVPATEPPLHEFRWGPRAKAETTKRNVLDFVCQIYGMDGPQLWTSQWQDVVRSEGGDPEAPVNGEGSR